LEKGWVKLQEKVLEWEQALGRRVAQGSVPARPFADHLFHYFRRRSLPMQQQWRIPLDLPYAYQHLLLLVDRPIKPYAARSTEKRTTHSKPEKYSRQKLKTYGKTSTTENSDYKTQPDSKLSAKIIAVDGKDAQSFFI
jgi:hypothetical protein